MGFNPIDFSLALGPGRGDRSSSIFPRLLCDNSAADVDAGAEIMMALKSTGPNFNDTTLESSNSNPATAKKYCASYVKHVKHLCFF